MRENFDGPYCVTELRGKKFPSPHTHTYLLHNSHKIISKSETPPKFEKPTPYVTESELSIKFDQFIV